MVQSARGNEVIIYSADSKDGRADYAGVEIRSVVCRRRMPLRDFEFMWKVRRELEKESADVLHFHSLAEGATFTKNIPAKKFLSFDYFVFRRGKKTPLFPVYRSMLRQFSCLLPVSEYCRKGYEAYWGRNGVPIRVLYNGVNLDQFAPDEEAGLAKRRALGIENQRVILYVGRVCQQKGTDILTDAYQLMKQRIPDVRLVVAGPAEQFATSVQTDLTRRITEAGGLYLGPVPEWELPAIYNLCEVFVMPTRSAEMYGMAAAEAQACGKPVVCSRHGGLPEVVSPESGAFFPVGNAAALAEELCRLLADRGLYRRKAEWARKNASRFAWSKIVDKLEGIYRG